MAEQPTIITALDVYVTRSGRLVFITEIEHNESASTMEAHGYSIAGSRNESAFQWRVWALTGEVLSGEGREWDIVDAV